MAFCVASCMKTILLKLAAIKLESSKSDLKKKGKIRHGVKNYEHLFVKISFFKKISLHLKHFYTIVCCYLKNGKLK